MKQNKGSILIVDDIPENIDVLMGYLSSRGYRTLVAEDGESALEQVKYSSPDIILLDIMMPGMDGYETCRKLKKNPDTKNIPVIFLTALSDAADIVRGFELGAVDYITKPIKQEEVLARVSTHLTINNLRKKLERRKELLEDQVAERTRELTEANATLNKEIGEHKKTEEKLRLSLEEVEKLKNRLQAENMYLLEEIKVSSKFDKIITKSPKMKTVLKQIEQVAATDAAVLILGETGTGKELLAKAIHDLSPRNKKPLIKVNCAALPANLIESELFGHEKGAFTGALMRKTGRFELADKGTIFLDEIGDLPLDLQSKLLRVLQEGDFERLGNPQTTHVDIRVIAATNRNLEEEIEKGNFRKDLFYRLSVFPVLLPPLRERLEDVPILVSHFVKKYSRRLGKSISNISDKDMELMQSYHWPGNIRELENIIERGIILSNTDTLTVDSPVLIKAGTESAFKENIPPQESASLKDIEKEHITRQLEKSNWIIDGKRGAAKKLGLPPSTLRDKMKKLGIKRP